MNLVQKEQETLEIHIFHFLMHGVNISDKRCILFPMNSENFKRY